MPAYCLPRTIGAMCIGLVSAAHGQNLISDPGFEQYMFGCAQGLDLEDLMHWDLVIGASLMPDYYHTCNGENGFPQVGVPTNLNGVEEAHGGDAYCGMLTYSLGWNGNPRDYLNTQLSAPLEAGVEYCFQAWLSRADTAHCATGVIQGWLVTGDAPNLFADPDDDWFANAPFMVGTLQVGSVGWTLVQSTFTATGGENNLTIGHFAHGEEIDTINIVNDFPYSAYYYIDDVYLGPCAGIGIPERKNRAYELSLSPNPALAGGAVYYAVSDPMGNSSAISIFNMAGQCVRSPIAATSTGSLALEGLAKGTYVVVAFSEQRTSRELLVIQ